MGVELKSDAWYVKCAKCNVLEVVGGPDDGQVVMAAHAAKVPPHAEMERLELVFKYLIMGPGAVFNHLGDDGTVGELEK